MIIFKNILKVLAAICIAILAITKNPIAAIVLLAVSSMHLGALITEHICKKEQDKAISEA